ncbi:MAG: enoyl-CoA hydratase/isomerase family protein [Novosphingobium sp.]
MDVADLTIDARRLWSGEAQWDGPVAFVDLDKTKEAPTDLILPPCPVIALGDLLHPFAASLDAVIEPPFTAPGLANQVLNSPLAAAVIVQLLRILPRLSPEDGLTAESLAYGLLQGSVEHRAWIAERHGRDQAARTAGAVAVEREGDVLNVTLENPASGNAIDRAMRDALYDAFTLAALDPELRTIALRGEGRTFSLGAELGEFGTTSDPATAHDIRARTLPARAVVRCAHKFEVHVQGGCVGAGLEIAAWAKHFTAAPGAWFQLPELAMGILPGAGGCVSLTRRIGRQRTALLTLSGRRISAKRALGWGLIDAIVDQPPGDHRGADKVCA